ncbi:MAG: V4R domain-containing protein [Promethearchaeota archaeon]
MLLEVFIIQKGTSFLLVRYPFTKKELQMDGTLFSGMISAISLFTNELKIGEIQFFETKDHQIIIHALENIIAVGVVENKKEDDFVIKTLKNIAQQFIDKYSEKLNKWNGDIGIFVPFSNDIAEIFYSRFAEFYIARDFPQNIIKVIRNIQNKFEPHIIRFIGLKIGHERASNVPEKQLQKLRNNENEFGKPLLKIVEKEINHFSISQTQYIDKDNQNFLEVFLKICPECRGIHDPEFSCHFITGFLEGFLDRINPVRKWIVSEKECHARGDPNCVFKAIPHLK